MVNNKHINVISRYSEKEDYWICKIEDSQRTFFIDNILNKINEYTYQYEIRTLPKKEISGNALFLFFDEVSKEWLFSFKGSIKNTEEIKVEESNSIDNKKKILKITFDKIQHLQTSISLYSLQYSLKSIKNYEYPWQSMKAGLNKISEIEYISIVEGEFYYSRTFFYKLFGALPKEHKITFYNQIFELSHEKNKIKNNCNELLELLLQYIEKNIYNSSVLFRESVEILKKIDSNIDLSEIGFDKSDKPIDYLNSKFEDSKEFISIYDDFPSLDKVKSYYSNFKKTETEFYKVFKSVPFPTELL